MEKEALIAALAAMIPLIAYIIRSDLKELRIPNWSVLAVVGVFVVTGLWGLPLESFLWRLAAGVIALLLGFGLYALASAKVGGGDLKLIAALVPFVAARDVLFVIVVYVFVTFTALIIHRLIRRFLRGRQIGWKAIDQKIYFPVGLLLGLTILIYLGTLLLGHYWVPEPA